MRSASKVRPGWVARIAWVTSVALLFVACGTSTQRLESPEASPGPSNSVTASPTASSSFGPGETPSAGTPTVPETSIDSVDKRLAVELAGDTIYLRNGGQILIGDGLAVEIFLDPYPPTFLRSTMDVYLTKDGRGIADGGVEAAYDMLAMGHGPFSGEAQNIGGGHYLLPLDYIMFGPWEQIVTIRLGLQRIHLPIIVVAYP